MNLQNQSCTKEPASLVLLSDFGSEPDNVTAMLAEQGYSCTSVTTVGEVAERVAGGGVDLLIITCSANPWRDLMQMRQRAASYLPVLVISDQLDDAVLDHYAAAEIDAVICRPVNFRLLLLKIRSSLRLRQLYQHEFNQKAELLAYRRKNELEREIATKLFGDVLKTDFLRTDAVEVAMAPEALLHGDIVLVAKTPENHLYLLVGNFTGRGVLAAIVATPLAEIFYGMTRKGFDIAEIVVEINTKLCKLLPADQFVAATLVALYPDSNVLHTVTCGLPEHFLIDHASRRCKTIPSLNSPLGLRADIEIQAQTYSVCESDSLYLFTAPAFAVENAAGQPFGWQRIVDTILQGPDDSIKNLHARFADYPGGSGRQNQYSLVKLNCAVDSVPWADSGSEPVQQTVPAMNWKQMMEFEVDALRKVNPVPVLVDTLMDIQGLQNQRQTIFLIVSELFANALDHGVLGLESSLKSSPEGFMRFYALKEERLQTQRDGKIRLSFAHRPTKRGGRLIIKVIDSGQGFDWQNWRPALDDNVGYSGRGIKLLETLCTSVVYQGLGNRVTAVFDWQR